MSDQDLESIQTSVGSLSNFDRENLMRNEGEDNTESQAW